MTRTNVLSREFKQRQGRDYPSVLSIERRDRSPTRGERERSIERARAEGMGPRTMTGNTAAISTVAGTT
jgi:hypothetical protein